MSARIDRFIGRHERDVQKEILLRQIGALRNPEDGSRGWTWSQLTLALADAIDGIRSEPIHHAYAEYAGPWRLWEAVHIVIAEAWAQERNQAAELRADEQASTDDVRRIARHAVLTYRQRH